MADGQEGATVPLQRLCCPLLSLRRHGIKGGGAPVAGPGRGPGLPSQHCRPVAGRTFRSRLIVGTGRYKDLEETGRAIEASGAEIVTVAVRRVNLSDPNAPMLQDYVDPKKYTYLPNTAGCFTAKEAVRTLRLA